jgi:hypothetical protein
MTSTIKVNNVQNTAAGKNIINESGNTVTIGASGDTVALASGASQTGFGQTYSAVSWDTTPKTTTVTGVAGVGYFVNTSGGAVTANLPAGVAGDVINEIGGSSEDKSDSITLGSAERIDQLTFTRTEIKNEDWSNTLRIDVDYEKDGSIDDTMYVFDHYNQNLGFRAVEKLYLDDGWDSDEIWNLVTGETKDSIDSYTGTEGQDILMAGIYESVLAGGDGKDILIGENIDGYTADTTFLIGTDNEWDKIADMIQNFGTGDKLDLSNLGITDNTLITSSENKLSYDGEVVAEFSNFRNDLTIEDILLADTGHLIYG